MSVEVALPDTVELSCDSYGDVASKRSIVIAHGLFGSSTNWRGIARKLSSNARVLCVDMRNHGESPWHKRHDYLAMAADLARFVDKEISGSCMLVGHSMGGKAAMTAALHAVPGIQAIVVVDIAPVNYGHTHDGFISAMQSVDLNQVTSRSDVDELLSSSIPEKSVRQFLLQNLVTGDTGWRWRINLDVLDTSMGKLVEFPEGLGQSQLPAHFIYGTESDYVNNESAAAISATFPNASFSPIEKAGHWVHAEQPAAVIDAISTFASESS